jgi:hypothetical protein
MGNERVTRPNRNTLRTKEGWEAVGRRVRPGEDGILHVSLKTKRIGIRGRRRYVEATRSEPVMRTVYHISQTEPTTGDAPDPSAENGGAPRSITDR